MRLSDRLTEGLRDVFGLDLRSLAVMRIGFGIILLLDIIVRCTDLEVHYSDAGMFPRSVIAGYYSRGETLSLHMASGSSLFAGLLFGVQAVAAAAMTVGWRTRQATIVSWLLLYSLHVRNPVVINGGDMFLLMAMLWACFLPLGRIWSVDSRMAPTVTRPAAVACGFSSAGFVVQLAALYLFSVALKSGHDWREGGTAIYYALSLDIFVKQPQTAMLMGYPELMVAIFYILLGDPHLLVVLEFDFRQRCQRTEPDATRRFESEVW